MDIYISLRKQIIVSKGQLQVTFSLKKKPAAQAEGADPSKWNFTSRQNPFIQQNPVTFKPIQQFICLPRFKISEKMSILFVLWLEAQF